MRFAELITSSFFFFNDTATTEIYTLSLHDALPIWAATNRGLFRRAGEKFERVDEGLRLPNIAFFGLYESRDGRVFAGGPAGLFIIENRKLRPYATHHEVEE